MNKKEIMLEKIREQGFPNKEAFVTIKDFFDGNTDDGSIGVNIFPDPPTLQVFEDVLNRIENNKYTEKILIRIADIEDTDWFFSDAVYIWGNYTLPEVRELFNILRPDDVIEGMMYGAPSNIPLINHDVKVYSIWWD